jgi:nickel-dependent lactate racemase
MLVEKSFANRYLTDAEIEDAVREALAMLAVDGKRVLILIPDGTRTMPMHKMFELFDKHLAPRLAALDYLVALGTHQPMEDAQLTRLVGHKVIKGKAGRSHIFNHQWENPDTFAEIGTIPQNEIDELSVGLMRQSVPVRLNRMIFDYDQLLICGPVFPHEVVGFSGGNKYFFPGIAGPEIINFTHWLGAMLTNYRIIGSGYTPVRAVIDRAAAFITKPVACFSLVVTHLGVSGVFFGSAKEAWKAAAALSAEKHILYVDKPYKRVLSVMPELYDDLWTAAKGMYKMEPAVADGGEIIIYAPHITEVSYTHGKVIDQIGYHCQDYFIKQWEKFKDFPGGVLAHSTHLRGMGQYNPDTRIETPRIQVTLATGIPEERCLKINLGYMNPSAIHPEEWKDQEDKGILMVPRAGEMLYKLKGN